MNRRVPYQFTSEEYNYIQNGHTKSYLNTDKFLALLESKGFEYKDIGTIIRRENAYVHLLVTNRVKVTRYDARLLIKGLNLNKEEIDSVFKAFTYKDF